MVTLLSRTSLLNIESIYDLFVKDDKTLDTVKTKAEDTRKNDIDSIMNAIQKDARIISALLKEKIKVYSQIQTRLDFLRRTKASLNDPQIESFAAFTALDRRKNIELMDILDKIKGSQDLKQVKKELLHNEADYELIYRNLAEFQNCQQMARACLNGMVEDGHKMLSLLQSV